MARVQKPVLVLVTLAFAVVLAAATFLGRQWLVESWYLARFESSDPAIKRAAAGSLARLRSARAVPRFLEHYEAQARAQDEDFASPILAELDPTGMTVLGRELRRVDPQLTLLCAELYAQIETPRSSFVPVLRAALRSENEGLRRWAAEELSRSGPEAAAAEAELRTAAKDSSELVRLWADIALEVIEARQR